MNKVISNNAFRAVERRKKPAHFEIDGHAIYYGTKVTSHTCSVSEGQRVLVCFAWLHDIKVLNADGCEVRRIN